MKPVTGNITGYRLTGNRCYRLTGNRLTTLVDTQSVSGVR